MSAPDPAGVARIAGALREVLRNMRCDFEGPSWLSEETAAGDQTGRGAPALTTGVRLKSLDGGTGLPDPWSVLMELRAHPDRSVASSISLNHVLSTAEQPGGNPFAIGHGRIGLDDYGRPGSGGRGPVTLVGGAPRPRAARSKPRVMVLDTAVGLHPWFEDDPVFVSFTTHDGRRASEEIHPYPRDDQQKVAVNAIANPMLGGLGTHTGHGTFIAGLLRQACPEAVIVALPLMGTDGVVPEHMLIRALDLVLTKQADEPGWCDAVVLSLGYYNETPDDVTYSSGLKALLLALARAGVAVFAAAGNDATTRPSFPAAFAVDREFAADDVLPMHSVAALNPDGTVAAFSNSGPWVSASALGVNLVSAAPVSLDGSSSPSVIAGRRAMIDLDNLRGGFASWSGTSFATPLLAGQYLASLVAEGLPEFDRRQLLLRNLSRSR